MAKVGAQRAADLTGKSKSTIQRAMKSGKISCEIDANGRRVVDVSELERAFGLLPQETERRNAESVEAELDKATQMLETERLRMRIRMLEDQLDVAREQIEDLKGQRDQWQKQAQQVLITSQYSQKQAEEYKGKLQERERIARMRRQQAANKTKAAPGSVNENRQVGPMEQQRIGISHIQGLWTKIRGQSEPKADSDHKVA